MVDLVENGPDTSHSNGDMGNSKDISVACSAENIEKPKPVETSGIEQELTTDATKEDKSPHGRILASLPSEYRDMMGQIGFAPWKSYKLPVPVLIMNPLKVPLAVREEWLSIYEKKKAKGNVAQMSYLVHWYGATEQDTRMYGFLTPRNFIPYDIEKAKAKSACELPPRLQKLDASSDETKWTTKDAFIRRGWSEMQADLLKEPSERQRGLPHDFSAGGKSLPKRARDIDPNDWRAVKSHQRRQSLG